MLPCRCFAMRCSNVASLLLVALLVLPLASAYPSFWVNGYSYPCALPTPATFNKPSAHPMPAAFNTNIKFTATDSAGTAVTNGVMCAGQSYTVKVAMPGGNNHYMIISSVPNSLPDNNGCNGARLYASQSQAVASYNTRVAVPAAATGTLVLSVGCSVGSGASIYRNSVTFTINTTCASPPPPPPGTPSPAPAPSPPPSSPPSGGNGTEPPTYYGKCSYTGACATCAAADRCWACSAGGAYVLNDATGKCDCAPGYKAVKSSKKKSSRDHDEDEDEDQGGNRYITCTKCSSTQVSPGGGMRSDGRTTATCTKCPSGQVPNREGSLCLVKGAWPMASMDYTNRRWNTEENILSPSTLKYMSTKWTYTPDGDVSATPTVIKSKVYFPTWKGSVVCVSADTGAQVWKLNVEALLTTAGVAINPIDVGYIVSRTAVTYAVASNGRALVVFGLMRRNIGGYPYVFAVDANTGAYVWSYKAEDHPAALITQAPTIYDGYVFIGTSSMEEARAGAMDYACCSFRGAFLKIRLVDGALQWKWYATPDGFTGAAVWGSQAPVDKARNLIYIATGDNYEHPQEVEDCLKALEPLTADNVPQQLECENKAGGASNYRNAIVALDITTGAVKWGTKLGGADAWNAACFQVNNTNCPDVAGPDYDFGQAPMLITACKANRQACKQLLVVGQKAGIVWALRPDTGVVDWWKQVGPPGTIGGMMWGSASDNERVYVSNNNFWHAPLDQSALLGVPNTPGATIPPSPSPTGGLAAAMNAYDGTLLWSFANPMPQINSNTLNALSQAPVTVANGVVLYPSMDAAGTLFFLDALTGTLLTSTATGASDACGPSVTNGVVITGSGYLNFGLGNVGQAVTAYSFTPALTKCGSLLCPNGCDGKRKCKGSPWCPDCGAKGCEDNGKCRK